MPSVSVNGPFHALNTPCLSCQVPFVPSCSPKKWDSTLVPHTIVVAVVVVVCVVTVVTEVAVVVVVAVSVVVVVVESRHATYRQHALHA